MKKIYGTTAEYISAFGSILGACSAFFSAFVAVYLFTDWKIQALHETKKEHLGKLITLTNKLRFNLIVKRQALSNMFKANDFAVINDEIKSLNQKIDSEIDEYFFIIRFSILYLNEDLSKDFPEPLAFYGKMHHHFIHISKPFWIIKYSYDRYYDYLKNEIDPIKLEYNHNIIDRSYNYFGIDFPFPEQTELLDWENRTIGYNIYDEKTQEWEQVRYADIIKMIEKLIEMIEKIEVVSIKILNPNDN
ncbi:hypothetical protein [uncultured Acinetobacter sp.]|uniref:hypothetical protein n=1 Tax=uncultured Acinetobacter sp. TaxID=165433 RepID=UPI00258BB155|nr:hypothetical protein [uncultured Acinetobacter sp.]